MVRVMTDPTKDLRSDIHEKEEESLGPAETAKDDASISVTDAQRWTNCYGSLILFFEEHGHTFVPSDHKNQTLYQWVEDQRGRVGELSQQQVKQLLIFNFKFDDAPWSPDQPWHCKCLGCTKFAAFNGFCHGHFITPAPDPATAKKKRPRPKPPKAVRVEFPLVGMKQRKNGNYDIESTKERSKDITRDEVINKLYSFVQKVSQVNCINNRGATSCTCLSFLTDKPFITESVTHALMDYYDLNHLQRKHYTVERLRYAEMAKRDDHRTIKGPQRIFSLPLSYEYFDKHHLPGATEGEVEDVDEEDNAIKQQIIRRAFKHRICTHAFHTLHNIGHKARDTLNKYANGDLSVGQNGNKGRKWPGGKRFAEAYSSMRDSLNVLMEEQRERQGLGPDDDVILPIQMSRRKCFEKWTWGRGWDIRKKNADTGQYAGSEEWDVLPGFYRTEEEAIAEGGDARNVAKLSVSWAVYSKFWISEFPKLKTRGRVGKGMFGGAYDFETKKYYNRKKL